MATGSDPKAQLLEYCKPKCTHWKDKLSRCEKRLPMVIKVDPSKSCMYPMRDYVTCVESCVQPKVHNYLKGTEVANSHNNRYA